MVIVTLQPTGLAELMVNEVGLNVDCPFGFAVTVLTGGVVIPTRVCTTPVAVAEGLLLGSPVYEAVIV